jgi:hypothetical protein
MPSVVKKGHQLQGDYYYFPLDSHPILVNFI